jgi:hypothetical protein
MSITDHRCIAFTPLALRFAIGAAGPAAQRLDLPGLPPEEVVIRPAEDRVLLRYGDAPRDVALGSQQLALLLIAYCVRARLPLARRAEKRIVLEPGAAVLDLVTRYEVPPEPVDTAPVRAK